MGRSTDESLQSRRRQRAEELVRALPQARSRCCLVAPGSRARRLSHPEGIGSGDLTATTPAGRSRHRALLRHVSLRAVRQVVVGVAQHCVPLAGAKSARAREPDASLFRGATSDDGLFTLEETECLADCDVAPCVQVNHDLFRTTTPRPSTPWSPSCVRESASTTFPARARLIRVRRSGGLHAAKAGLSWNAKRPRPRATSVRRSRPNGGSRGSGIVTSRLEYDDSYTLARYLATGRLQSTSQALAMFPEEVAAQVDEASFARARGAGFPAGRKWSCCVSRAFVSRGERRRVRAGDL